MGEEDRTTAPEQQQQEDLKDTENTATEIRGKADGEEKEPMIAVNVGMEVIEEGEEENGDEEKPKTQ